MKAKYSFTFNEKTDPAYIHCADSLGWFGWYAPELMADFTKQFAEALGDLRNDSE